jgi:predicted dehydrogenase
VTELNAPGREPARLLDRHIADGVENAGHRCRSLAASQRTIRVTHADWHHRRRHLGEQSRPRVDHSSTLHGRDDLRSRRERARTTAERFGCAWTTSTEELARAVDAVTIATPDHLHRDPPWRCCEPAST